MLDIKNGYRVKMGIYSHVKIPKYAALSHVLVLHCLLYTNWAINRTTLDFVYFNDLFFTHANDAMFHGSLQKK
jgi:hypothetical protein